MSKNEGSHGPQGPWAQNHKIIKVIKINGNHCFFGDAFFPEKKPPEGICDTVEKGLGPRPLGPIGPILEGP